MIFISKIMIKSNKVKMINQRANKLLKAMQSKMKRLTIKIIRRTMTLIFRI